METAVFNMLDKQFAYNLWANDALFGLCSGLSEAQLAVVAVGVVGSLQETLAHLAYAENNYVYHLSGKRPFSADLDWNALTVAELHERVLVTSGRLLDIASGVDLEKVHTYHRDSGEIFKFYSWSVALQALYHGIEHRTHVKLLLTQLGIAHPELASWDYTESLPINQSSIMI